MILLKIVKIPLKYIVLNTKIIFLKFGSHSLWQNLPNY